MDVDTDMMQFLMKLAWSTFEIEIDLLKGDKPKILTFLFLFFKQTYFWRDEK